MKSVLALLVAIAVVWQANAGRIIGGEPASVEQFPSIVQVEASLIGVTWNQFCAANILSPKYVLSAAHCFWGPYYDINNRRIRAGSSVRYSGGITVFPAKRLNHPMYRPVLTLSYNADISLLELATHLTFGNTIQPIAIPPQNFELPDNLPVIHAGWGDTVQGSELGSDQLLAVTVYTINRELCRERYSELVPYFRRITENMICNGILDVGGKGSCQGDSGGPMYYDKVLVGVVSWGEGCANGTYPGVSTRVSSYTNWILENAV